jgi:hypothetical protein
MRRYGGTFCKQQQPRKPKGHVREEDLEGKDQPKPATRIEGNHSPQEHLYKACRLRGRTKKRIVLAHDLGA